MSPRILFSLLIVLPALPHLAAAEPTYAVTPISGKYTSAAALNNAGQVAVNNRGPEVPYHIGSIVGATTSESVGTLGGYESIIRGMNNKGEAVGISQTASGEEHAFLYSGGRIQDLTIAYGLDSAADINDRGDIAGQLDERGALLRAGGTVDTFGPPGIRVTALNNGGDVVGDVVIDNVGIHAFHYTEGSLNDLGTLGGTFSVATAVNDADAVVGYGSTADERYHAFLYDDGVMTDLGPSTRASTANGLNNHGQVVGDMDGRAFLYAGGTLTDLNALIARDAGFLLVSASAINDRQQILATACDPSGTFCDSTVRLDPIPPIPEPGSIGMLLAGAALLGLHGVGRRSRAASQRPPNALRAALSVFQVRA